jgi:hypothetical protein
MTAAGSEEIAGGWFASGAGNTLGSTLRQMQRAGVTGRLDGLDPAGAEIHLADGLITAVVTPTAPGPDSLLLKSGRVSQSDWSAPWTRRAASGDWTRRCSRARWSAAANWT